MQIDPILLGSMQHQAWPWLAAVARIRVVMKTGQDIVQREFIAQTAVHLLDRLSRLISTGDVGLIRHNKQKKIVLLQASKGSCSVRFFSSRICLRNSSY